MSGMLRGKEKTRKEPVHNKKHPAKHHLMTIPHQEFDIAESFHLCQRVPEGAPDVAVH
jgi:hypothetical protein